MGEGLRSPGAIGLAQAEWQAPIRVPAAGNHEMAADGLMEEKLALMAERPLPDIHLESLRATNEFRVGVGFHEAAHALGAIAAGDEDTIVRVSVIPGDDGSAGHTLFSSSPDAATVGASFHLHDGGTAGDEAHLRSMAKDPWNADGLIRAAASEGERRVKSFPFPVREKLAHALARFGVVSGRQFRELLAQALWEERWKRKFGESPPVDNMEKVNLMAPKEEELPKFMVKGPMDKNISREKGTLLNGDEYTRTYDNGKTTSEDVECRECKGVNGHLPGCALAQSETVSESAADDVQQEGAIASAGATGDSPDQELRQGNQKESIFPESGTIYVGSPDQRDGAKRSGKMWIMPGKPTTRSEDIFTEIEKPLPLAA